MSAPFPSDLIAAPDGRAIAWIGYEEGKRNIWVAEAPAWRAWRLTRWLADDGQDLSELSWTPDSRALLVVRGGDSGANHNDHDPVNPTSDPRGTDQSVWIAPLRAGAAARRLGQGFHPVASPRADRVVWILRDTLRYAPIAGGAPSILLKERGTSSQQAFSPDGRTLAFVSDRGDHAFIGLYDFARREVRWMSPGTFDDEMPRWSPDGKAIAFLRRNGAAYRRGERLPHVDSNSTTYAPFTVRSGDPASLASHDVWRSPSNADGDWPDPADDWGLMWAGSNRIVFASEQTGWIGMYSVNAEGGEATRLTPTGCEVYNVAMARDRESIVYDSNCGDIERHHVQSVHVLGGTPRELTSGSGIEWKPQPLGDSLVALLRSDAQHPGAPALTRGDSLHVLEGWPMPEAFPAGQLVTPTQVLVTAADSTVIHCQLFLPPNPAPNEKHPAVMFFHGGPSREMVLGFHFMHYYSNAYAFNQYLASRGFTVLSVNYRGGVGYGRAFRQASGRGRNGASEYQDLVAAATWLRARPDVDTSRIGLWGGSYGGYMTALGLARNSDWFAAGFDLHGVHDYAEESESTHRFGVSDSAIAAMRRASAIGDVATWRSPVLLVQGDDDRNVQFQQTVDLALRLRREGVRVEELVFPDEIHDFLRHANWLAAYRAGAGFLSEVLRR
ncbi:MAG TPA: prolyl oligopeptidase family serine peptidase [Gemmatimonadales bacterium]